MSRKSKAETVALEDQPGYYIRRLQQKTAARDDTPRPRRARIRANVGHGKF